MPETDNLLDNFATEEKRRLRFLLKSDDFRMLFVEKLIVPRLEMSIKQLRTMTNDRDTDMKAKASAYSLQRLLDHAAHLAGLPSLFTTRDAIMLDTKKWVVEDTKDHKDDEVSDEQSDPPENTRVAFFAE